MILLSFSQVLLRTFFHGGFTWADAMLRNMVLWVGFIGASLATKNDRHIEIDALTKFLSQKWKAAADVLTSTVSFLIGLVFIYASYHFVNMEYQSGTKTFLEVPFWVVQMIIPVGFGFISLRFLIKVIEDISYLKSHFGKNP